MHRCRTADRARRRPSAVGVAGDKIFGGAGEGDDRAVAGDARGPAQGKVGALGVLRGHREADGRGQGAVAHEDVAGAVRVASDQIRCRAREGDEAPVVRDRNALGQTDRASARQDQNELRRARHAVAHVGLIANPPSGEATKATKRPSGVMSRPPQHVSVPGAAPPGRTLTSSVLSVTRSRTKTSQSPVVPPATRLLARL